MTEDKSTTVDLSREIDKPLLLGTVPRLLGKFPFNEVLKLSIDEKTFTLDIAPEFEGLKICQLSDLHFTGQIDVAYFEKIVEKANAFEPDIVLITGDLVDETECLPWLDTTLGKLRPKIASYYVLGNHDLRVEDEKAYREKLAAIGLKKLAGQWTTIQYGGQEIKITGNELPWFKGAENIPTAHGGKPESFKILASHSPDQKDWARPYNFDLMLAGHTHGGQIALPFIGPIVAPSRYGVLYASGTFMIGDMLMHVSRGISGDEPIRIGSKPELGLFTIRSKNA